MSAVASRMAAKVGSSATRVAQASRPAQGKTTQKTVPRKAAKRDPELYILLTVMTSVFGLAGYHFGMVFKPEPQKEASSVNQVMSAMAEGKSPWQDENAEKSFKYQYHPGGDKSKSPKVAPSALRSTIVPNVTLTKV
ncbi:MAG: hypothetical protein LQ351_007591 [Letrouitia transgressa]|nr:MAG: hypothetical protein LQ351_007591 [Letrouitia transgressa]